MCAEPFSVWAWPSINLDITVLSHFKLDTTEYIRLKGECDDSNHLLLFNIPYTQEKQKTEKNEENIKNYYFSFVSWIVNQKNGNGA